MICFLSKLDLLRYEFELKIEYNMRYLHFECKSNFFALDVVYSANCLIFFDMTSTADEDRASKLKRLKSEIRSFCISAGAHFLSFSELARDYKFVAYRYGFYRNVLTS